MSLTTLLVPLSHIQGQPAVKAAQDTAKTAPVPLYRPALTAPPPVPQNPAVEPQVQQNQPAGQAPDSHDYLEGKLHGQQDARGRKIWLLAGLPGLCCYGVGGVGVLAAFLIPPEPPVSSLIGKSTAYILGYSEGYRSKGRWKNAMLASMGCAVGTAAVLIMEFAVLASDPTFW